MYACSCLDLSHRWPFLVPFWGDFWRSCKGPRLPDLGSYKGTRTSLPRGPVWPPLFPFSSPRSTRGSSAVHPRSLGDGAPGDPHLQGLARCGKQFGVLRTQSGYALQVVFARILHRHAHPAPESLDIHIGATTVRELAMGGLYHLTTAFVTYSSRCLIHGSVWPSAGLGFLNTRFLVWKPVLARNST